MSLPGFTTGSRIKTGPGDFCKTDALVLYLLKFHQQKKVCPPVEVVASALVDLNDTELHKKAVSIFWLDYSTTSNLNEGLNKEDFLKNNFEWYILTKFNEKQKIRNARLAGFVGSGEAWHKAISAQKKYYEKVQQRENEFILKRESYRVVLDTQRALDAAEKAISSGY